MPVTAMTPIQICHALEYFYFAIDMFNDNSSPGKLFIFHVPGLKPPPLGGQLLA
jgi:hypothetical protein